MKLIHLIFYRVFNSILSRLLLIIKPINIKSSRQNDFFTLKAVFDLPIFGRINKLVILQDKNDNITSLLSSSSKKIYDFSKIAVLIVITIGSLPFFKLQASINNNFSNIEYSINTIQSIKSIKNIDSIPNNLFIDQALPNKKQITKAAFRVNDKNTYQLFSHGRSGELLINGKWLEAKEISEFLQSEFKTQNSEYSHLNIYGCSFAEGKKGIEAVKYLEDNLCLIIAASNDTTGKDGDWDLEVGTTKNPLRFEKFGYNLQCTGPIGDCDNDGVTNHLDLDDDNDGISDVNEGYCNSTTLQKTGNWNIVDNTATFDYGGGLIARITTTQSNFISSSFNPLNNFWSEPLQNAASIQSDFPWNSIITVRYEDGVGNPVLVNNPIIHIDRLGAFDFNLLISMKFLQYVLYLEV